MNFGTRVRINKPSDYYHGWVGYICFIAEKGCYPPSNIPWSGNNRTNGKTCYDVAFPKGGVTRSLFIEQFEAIGDTIQNPTVSTETDECGCPLKNSIWWKTNSNSVNWVPRTE